MSNERSSSAVRDLRSIFELKQSESNLTDNQQQQTSSNRDTSKEGHRPRSRVRSSFVPVEGGPRMASTSENEVPMVEEVDNVAQESTASLRRASFHENAEDGEQLAALKTVVSQENERREKDSSVAEAIPEAAIESGPATPVVEFRKGMALAPDTASRLANAGLTTESTANPDKPVTSRDEEEPGTLRPAEPTDAAAIEQTPIPNEPEPATAIEREPAATIPLAKIAAPSAHAAKPATKSASAKDLSRKVSRSSLAAPTASSVARIGLKRESLPTGSAAARPREVTKPVRISSHLLAPTAASRARQEQDKPSGTIPSVGREVTKPATVRPTRTSLARSSRPASQTSDTTKRSIPSTSFLDRMTKPTAASQNRSQEKYESKSPRKSLPLHKKPAVIGSGAKSAVPISALVEEEREPVADPSTPTKAPISTS